MHGACMCMGSIDGLVVVRSEPHQCRCIFHHPPGGKIACLQLRWTKPLNVVKLLVYS